MPAKVKESEYKTNFKWLESFRRKGFKPAPEQMAPPAGLGSVFSSASGPSAEPPLQHKKRVEGPQSSLSINFDEGNGPASDEFAILGQHEKFAPNVRYSLRPPKPSKLGNKATNLNNSNTVKDQPPPPKQMKMGDRQTRTRRKLDVSDSKEKKGQSKENVTPSSPPPAPRKPKQTDQQVVKEGLRDKNLSDILPRAKSAPPPKDSLNEFAQTNLDKGVALSAPEAPADFSLKYKAGIAPKLGRKASEYQKEFRWRNALPASPLLTAEQIVYSSNAPISPLKEVKFQRKTEYQAQFKPYEIPDSVSFAPKPSQEPAVTRGGAKAQMKRSKSVGAVDRVAAGSAPVTSADDPRLLRQSRDSSPAPKVPVPHGKLKRVVSEYRSNFKAPTAFSYEEGAWRNAYPQQLAMVKNGSAVEKEEKVSKKAEKVEVEQEEAGSVPSWFAEVLELRRRANEYKRRAQGTHFSREHLVQLLAQQAAYWDDSDSTGSVTALDALALEPAKAPARRSKQSKQEEDALDKMSHVAVRGDSPKPLDRNNNRGNKRPEKRGRSSKRNKIMAWQEKSQQERNTNQNAAVQAKLDAMEDTGVQADILDGARESVAAQAVQDFTENEAVQVNIDPSDVVSDTAVQTELDEEEVQGRLPTPLMRQGVKASRHHLDRTTPSIGGVLLSAPQQPLPTDRSGDSAETASECQSSPKVKLSALKLATSPILGRPTPDTHPLRDDDAESDHALQTQYVASPPVALTKAERKKKRAEQRKLNAKVPTTINEQMAQTYNKDIGNFHVEDLPLPTSHVVEDDALSLSAMSIASSSSLASEVYERARKRRDEFWGKPRQ